MRFLHLNHRYAPYVGGSERYMQEVSSMLAGDGHRVSVITSNASDLEYFWDARRKPIDAPQSEEVDGVFIHRSPVGHFPLSPLVFQGSRRLMGEASRLPVPAQPFVSISSRLPRMPGLRHAIMEVGAVDLIHAANLGLEGIAAAAHRRARQLGVPFLLTPFLHLGPANNTVAKRYVSMPHQRNLLHMAAHIVVMTHIEASFIKEMGIAPDRLTVSGVGIHPSELIGGDSARFRDRFAIEGSLVGTAGAVAIEKGSRELVMAVSNLRKRGHAVELVLAGPRLQQFDQWFASLDETSTRGIHIPGFITPDEKRDMLAALDVVAMPSRTESFGIAYLEGWANRKPVLAARAGAVPELVVDGTNGLLVEFGNVSEIEEGILRLLASPDVSKRLGAEGYALTMDRYTWPRVLQRIRCAYSAALGFEIPEIVSHA